MSFLKKITKWSKGKTYVSFRDVNTFAEKNNRIFSNAELVNIIISHLIITVAIGIFCSIIFFRFYIDPSYQEEKNKIMITELYKDLEKVKQNNLQRNNFLISLQNFMNNKDDFYSEDNIKNYNIKHFCSPVANIDKISNFEHDDIIKLRVEKNDKILAIADGIVIFKDTNKNSSCIILQHQNGYISIYNFEGISLKNIEDNVMIGENIAIVNKKSELCLKIFNSAQKISPKKLFIN